MKQKDLFVKGSETSKAAAEDIREHRQTLRERVYGFIAGAKWTPHRGATDEQIQIGLDMDPSTERPRRVELVKAGRVVDSGRRTLTLAGRSATIWEVK